MNRDAKPDPNRPRNLVLVVALCAGLYWLLSESGDDFRETQPCGGNTGMLQPARAERGGMRGYEEIARRQLQAQWQQQMLQQQQGGSFVHRGIGGGTGGDGETFYAIGKDWSYIR